MSIVLQECNNNMVSFREPEIRPNFSGSHTFSLAATAKIGPVFVSPCPPECYYKAKRRLSLISGYFLGSKKAWATPRSVSFSGLIQNFRRASPPPFICGVPSPWLLNKRRKSKKTEKNTQNIFIICLKICARNVRKECLISDTHY